MVLSNINIYQMSPLFGLAGWYFSCCDSNGRSGYARGPYLSRERAEQAAKELQLSKQVANNPGIRRPTAYSRLR